MVGDGRACVNTISIMDSSVRLDHRPAKRRRLENVQVEGDAATEQPTYITLAHAKFPAHIPSPLHAEQDGIQVDIKGSTHTRSTHVTEVTLSWSKTTVVVQIECDDYSSKLLTDCQQLESSRKYLKQKLRIPLACYEAYLDLDAAIPTLGIKILWHDSTCARDRIGSEFREVLHRYVPGGQKCDQEERHEPWHVREFYDSVHVPEANKENNAALKVDLLHCELYPFQRRAVRWLLSREGVSLRSSGQVVESRKDGKKAVMLEHFRETQDAEGNTCYVNLALGVVSSSKDQLRQQYGGIRGGLLGEAMGLGKTVEMIALMSLHTMGNSPLKPSNPSKLRRSGATLIITPPTILEQWKQEIQTHAPSLRVYHYQGLKSMKKKAIIDELADQDVVLTTYNVVAKELHYVMEKPDRSLRNRPRPDPPRSPLDQILWWRVCLDEAQMIESGVSAAATVARLIPRANAWAVTGTPLKQSDKDLFGLLLFLRYEPWSISLRLWTYLVHYHRPLFRALVNEIAIRHSKEIVRDELRLPPQNRHSMTISFSNIEQTHYSSMFFEMAKDCGLDRDGTPLDDQWDPESPKTTEKMRSWLIRLRQTCLHPEVGGRNRKALGRNNGPLRSVQQVLDVMIDQTEGTLCTEQRDIVMNKIRQGQLLENAKRPAEALEIYREAYQSSCGFVSHCRKLLEVEISARTTSLQEKEADIVTDEDDTEDSPTSTARQRLRSALEVQHVCIFFIGNIYFQLKSAEESPESQAPEVAELEKKETQSYDIAKKIRTELLAGVLQKANRQIANIKSEESERQLVLVPLMEVSLDDYAGIESRRIFDKLYHFCEAMNAQAEQLRALRQKMVDFLQQALIDEDDGVELKGDEYESSTKHQDEMYAYMEALRAIYADRADAVSGQENLLIRSEMKQFLRAAKEGEGPAPEMMINLLAERETKRINITEQGSLRGILAEIRALVSALEFQELNGRLRAKAEMDIATKMLQHANKLMSAQTKALTGLEQEAAYFRNSMNARLEYYKALQKISDTVEPFREADIGKPVDMRLFGEFTKAETSARSKCSAAEAKQRYLLHLKKESDSDNTPRICTICREEFEVGAITSCGHVFCKEDLQLWYHAHGNCPVCKRRLRTADFFDVTYKPLEMKVHAEQGGSTAQDSPQSPDRTSSNSIYSDISETQLNQIKNIEIQGLSFGSKVDTICRHLHWLREQDPGSKTIIFSQFREFLDVLGRAFNQNAITYTRCDSKDGIQNFKSHPATECFLLHAKAHAAGLNLVVASHVILCEPLINTAIELQAIARVHRIGQHRATTVWMYLISGTVEESIYDISVKRRLAHIRTRDASSSIDVPTPAIQESTLDAANSKELQAADLSKALTPGKTGGEMVNKEDLWPCLFGNVSKNVNTGLDFLNRDVESIQADSEVGRFLRGEAAEGRRRDG